MKKSKVLFLCTGNSCRSQMAEGFANHLWGEQLEAYSAGLVATQLNPIAVRVMAEVGIDISAQQSEALSLYESDRFDLVVTVCSHADESCPVVPGWTHILHRGFDDPPKLAVGIEDEMAVLEIYRRVREEIRILIETLPSLVPCDKPSNKREGESYDHYKQ